MFNTRDSYNGFYVLFSGANYITDYVVVAIAPQWTELVVGRVTRATSNFTAVNFYSGEGYPEIVSDTMFLKVYGLAGNSTADISPFLSKVACSQTVGNARRIEHEKAMLTA